MLRQSSHRRGSPEQVQTSCCQCGAQCGARYSHTGFLWLDPQMTTSGVAQNSSACSLTEARSPKAASRDWGPGMEGPCSPPRFQAGVHCLLLPAPGGSRRASSLQSLPLSSWGLHFCCGCDTAGVEFCDYILGAPSETLNLISGVCFCHRNRHSQILEVRPWEAFRAQHSANHTQTPETYSDACGQWARSDQTRLD